MERTSEILIYVRCPPAGTACPEPRSPSRRKMGARMLRIVMRDTATCSIRPPSTNWIEIPTLGNGRASNGGGGRISGRPESVQFRNTMFLKLPLDSVPILSPLRMTRTSARSVKLMRNECV